MQTEARQQESVTDEPTSVSPSNESYAKSARILTIGIASTGLFTFLYLAVASHVLTPPAYSRIALCFAVMYVIVSVIYRPIEQLLSRTIADRRARGARGHPLRIPAAIQLGFAVLFLATALALRHQIQQGMFDGSGALYWVLVIGTLAYAASYFARGWLGGHQRFDLYGGLVFLESTSRFLLALAVAVGIGSGQSVVAYGMLVAPFASLCVIPFAFSRVRVPGGTAEFQIADAAREGPAHAEIEEAATDLTLKHGTGFAVSVVGIMLAEQTLMNAGVLIVAASSGGSITTGLTGFVFNVLLIVRAPLQLFQAIQTAILPHLARLVAHDSTDEFGRAIRATILLIAAFAGACAIGLLAVGPPVMTALLGHKHFEYGRFGLALVAVGMGLHLVSGTLNQAALARGRAALASIAWLCAGALFVAFVATPTITSEVSRVEVGYFMAAAVLCALLVVVYRWRPAGAPAAAAS